MNDQTNGTNLPVNQGALNILNKSRDGAKFERLVKYDKGQYYSGGDVVPLGTKVIAHCIGWSTAWIKFVNKEMVERRIYSVDRGEVAPERSTLDDQDQTKWEIGFNNAPKDPWVFQNLLPLQLVEGGERMIFATSSGGGERAIKEICYEYADRKLRQPDCGQPIVKMQSGTMPSKTYGKVMRPRFDIVGWANGDMDIVSIPNPVLLKGDLGDEIPF